MDSNKVFKPRLAALP